MNISQTKDFELLARLNHHVQDLHAKRNPEYFKPYQHREVRDTFRYLVRQNEFVFLLLEDHDEPIGYAWLELRTYPENPFMKSYRSVYVHQIGLTEDQKKKGYGTALMEEVYNVAKEHGIELVELEYWSGNKEAQQFYRKLNFERSREVMMRKV